MSPRPEQGGASGRPSSAFKVRENRARRAARRQGLELLKSRQRDPFGRLFGVYWLERQGGERLEGPGPDGSWESLEAVEAALTRPTGRRR